MNFITFFVGMFIKSIYGLLQKKTSTIQERVVDV